MRHNSLAITPIDQFTVLGKCYYVYARSFVVQGFSQKRAFNP